MVLERGGLALLCLFVCLGGRMGNQRQLSCCIKQCAGMPASCSQVMSTGVQGAVQTAVTGLWRTGHVPIHSGASYPGIASQLAYVCSGMQWLLCAIPSGQGELSRPWAYAVSVRCEVAVVAVLWVSGFLVCSASEGLAQSGAVVELVTTTLPLCPGRSGTAAPVLSPSVAPPVAQAPLPSLPQCLVRHLHRCQPDASLGRRLWAPGTALP